MLCLRYKPGVPQITSRLSCDRCHIIDTIYTSTYDNSLIKPLVQLIYHTGVVLIIYFREHSRITDYCYSRSMVLSLWKSFFARFFSRYKLPCHMGKWNLWDSNPGQTRLIRPPLSPTELSFQNGISAVSNIFIVLCLSTRKYFLFPKPPGTCDAPLVSIPLGGRR